MSGDRKDNDLRGSARRSADARGARSTRRAFRPLRLAWLLLLAALLAPAFDLLFPAGIRPPRQRRTVVIERGQSLHEIARELQRNGVIKSQVGFLVLARAMSLDRSVKAGQYSFRLGMTVPAILRALDRGMYGLNLITIPEGLMIRETARLIQMQVGIPVHQLDSLAHDPMLLDSLEIGAPSLEGWLAPDSYEWLPGTAPEVVLRTMVARTRERVQKATAGYDSLPLGMNSHEVLTLASIVESESRANDERPRIARVYLNRLERGMLLQADPTVGYALGRGPRSRLLFKDLRVVSPYNTYRHEGLPPGPICSPGESAIQAVMNATPGTTDLYFVANGKGRHIFAPTYQQHLANIALVKSRMRAEALASAKSAAAKSTAALEEDVVVGGDVGDSGAVRPPSAPAPAPLADAAGSAASDAASQQDPPRAAAPPIVNLPRLAPTAKATAGSTTAQKTGSATAVKSSTAKPATAKPATSKPAPQKLEPSTPVAGGKPLKGDLLVPRKTAAVASSTPGSVEVVRKPVATDTSRAVAKPKLASKPASVDPLPAKSSSGSATKSEPKPASTDPAPAKSSSGATTKSEAKPASTAPPPAKSTSASTTKSEAKPASTDPAPAKSTSGAAKPATADTSAAKPQAKAATKPAPADTSRAKSPSKTVAKPASADTSAAKPPAKAATKPPAKPAPKPATPDSLTGG